MYRYGYFIDGQKVILGIIDVSELKTKEAEIRIANEFDPSSKWFIEPVDEKE